MVENVPMPKLGLTMTRGTVVKWFKKEREEVKKGEAICQVETDKITSEVESPSDGYIIKIIVDEGIEEKVLLPICIIGGKEELENYKESAGSTAVPDDTGIKISPLARKIADENNIDIRSIAGTGPDGRILKEDVIALLNKRIPDNKREKERSIVESSEKKEALSGVRSVIAGRLSESKRNIPHVYFKSTVNASEILKLKHQLSQKVEAGTGRKLTINDIIIKGVGKALEEFKEINVSLDNDRIIYHNDINIGIAVNSPKGLFVPVIKKANTLNISEINEKSGKLIEKVKEGKLAYEDMQGGTFTVSNLGAYYIDEFFAIINPPESAILAVGRVEDKPCVEDGAVVAKPLMSICLSADHRVIDGALAAQFMKKVKYLLENPYLLMI